MDSNIKKALVRYANATTKCVRYNWSNDFKVEELKESYDRLEKAIKLENLDFFGMTEEELQDYGFIKYPEDSNLMCVPLYLLDSFKQGTELICIDGTKKIVGKDYFDDNIYMGCIAYGIFPKRIEGRVRL